MVYKTMDGPPREVCNFVSPCFLDSSATESRFSRFYVNNNSVIIKSKPSAKLSESLEAAEKARIAEQKQALGPEGIEKVTKLLENAKKEHEKSIPSEVLTGFPVPDVKSISWIPVQSVRNDPSVANGTPPEARDIHGNRLEEHVKKDGEDLPFFVHFSNVKVCIPQQRPIPRAEHLGSPTLSTLQHTYLRLISPPISSREFL